MVEKGDKDCDKNQRTKQKKPLTDDDHDLVFTK